MAHGFKTGGRQVGTPNRNRTALRERLAFNYPDYDPLAINLQSRTAEHGLGWYHPQTEVGHGGLTSNFAASYGWGDYRAGALVGIPIGTLIHKSAIHFKKSYIRIVCF